MASAGKIFRNLVVGGFVVVVALFFVGEHANKAHSIGVATDASDDPSKPALKLPAAEQRFLAIVGEYSSRYQAAANDMARGALRPARARALCEYLNSTNTIMSEPWVGTVKTLSSNNDGKGVLAIQIADGITVSTTNNSLSDSLGPIRTLIEPTSNVGTAASALQVDQVVHFTGRFGSSQQDCIQVQDLTQEGAMTEPEFLMQFGSLRGG